MDTRHNTGSIVAGSILILFGLLALLGQLFRGLDIWGSFWPFLIIGCGALFFVAMLLNGKSAAGLAIPGSIIIATGLILLAQNLMGYWESWSYAWTLLVIAGGLGSYIMGAYSGDAQARRAGVHTMEVGFVLLIIFGAFFEGMIFATGRLQALGQFIFPVALILLGLYLVLVRSGLRHGHNPDALEQPDKVSKTS
jgi:hypothetical protein